jgi:hypothetical protein
MKNHIKMIWLVIIISIWINAAETIRWILFAKPYFIKHFQDRNIEPPGGPLYLIIWFLWGILISVIIFNISKKFSLLNSTLIIWFAVFSGIWIMLLNLKVITIPILLILMSICFIEILIGVLISKHFYNK